MSASDGSIGAGSESADGPTHSEGESPLPYGGQRPVYPEPTYGTQPPAGAQPPTVPAATPTADAYSSFGMAPLDISASGVATIGAFEDRPQRRWLPALIVGLVVVLIIASLGGFFAWKKLAATGDQPETMVPASALGYVEIDLDPSAGQKMKVVEQLRKLKSITGETGDPTDLRELLFKQMLNDSPEVDYDADIKPWIGDRLALALLPGEAEAVDTLVVVQHTDSAKAKSSMTKLAAIPTFTSGLRNSEMSTAYASSVDMTMNSVGSQAMPARMNAPLVAEPQADPAGFVVTDEFVVIGADQAMVDAAVQSAKEATIADDTKYSEDIKKIADDRLATVWFDGAKLGSLASAARVMGGTGDAETDKALLEGAGRMVVGARATEDGFEVQGRGLDATMSAAWTGRPAAPLTSLPAGTKAAMYVGNPGQYAQMVWDLLAKSIPDDMAEVVESVQEEFGIALPTDLVDGLGTDLVVGAGASWEEESNYGVRVASKDANKTLAQLRQLAEGAPVAPEAIEALRVIDNDLVWGLDEGYGKEFADGKGTLGETDLFKRAMEIDDKVVLAIFVELDAFKQYEEKVPSGAVGMTISASGADSTFTLRTILK